jgi:hypothetical protein
MSAADASNVELFAYICAVNKSIRKPISGPLINACVSDLCLDWYEKDNMLILTDKENMEDRPEEAVMTIEEALGTFLPAATLIDLVFGNLRRDTIKQIIKHDRSLLSKRFKWNSEESYQLQHTNEHLTVLEYFLQYDFMKMCSIVPDTELADPETFETIKYMLENSDDKSRMQPVQLRHIVKHFNINIDRSMKKRHTEFKSRKSVFNYILMLCKADYSVVLDDVPLSDVMKCMDSQFLTLFLSVLSIQTHTDGSNMFGKCFGGSDVMELLNYLVPVMRMTFRASEVDGVCSMIFNVLLNNGICTHPFEYIHHIDDKFLLEYIKSVVNKCMDRCYGMVSDETQMSGHK